MTKGAIRGALLGALLLAAPAGAQNIGDSAMLTAADPRGIAAYLQQMGYRATVDKQSDGDPVIKTAMAGFNVTVLFMSCTKNSKCEDVQFYTAVSTKQKLTLAQVNEFNSVRRFTRLYLDDEQDPFLELDLSMIGPGISAAAFADTVKVYESQVGNLRELIGSAD